MTVPNLTHAIAEMVRKMPDDEIVTLVRGQLDADTVPEPEPRRKYRKMVKAVPATTKAKKTAKKAKTSTGKGKLPDLTQNEIDAIKVVTNARSPLSVKEIAKKVKITPSAILGLMTRLAEKGLVDKIGEGGGKKRPNRWLFGPK